MERRLHSVFLFLLLAVSPLIAQEQVAYQKDAEKKFEYALEFYNEGAFYSAAEHFKQLADAYPAHHRTTAAYIMAARSYLQAKAPTRSLRLLEEMRLQFPDSKYLGESYLISGEAAAAADSPARAIEFYLRAWKSGIQNYERFTWYIEQLGAVTLTAYDRKVTENVLKTIDEADRLRPLLPLGQSASRAQGAKDRNTSESKTVETHVEEKVPQSVTIPVALPAKLKDKQKQRLVRELKRGMLLALGEHNKTSKQKVELKEIPSDDLKALRMECMQLERNPNAVIMLAGAFSADARTVCELLGERDILVLLPTATDAGLTSFGSNIFQMNTPIKDRARLLADFAFLELDAEAVCVISPDDSYPRAMADAFIKRCGEIGLAVKRKEFYRSAEGDLSEAFEKLSRGDGVKNCVLFAPVSSRKHIGSVLQGAGQTAGIRTILGGGNWNYPQVLKRHASNSTIYFESDVLPDESQRKMRALLRNREHATATVSREMIFGFDAMNLALHVSGDGRSTRTRARQTLRDLYEGLRAPVNFIDSRVNRAMNMLRCRRGEIELLDSFYAK